MVQYGFDKEYGWPDQESKERWFSDLQKWYHHQQAQNEGDFERMERTQEQAARAADEAEQDQDAEQPFGEHWHNLMMQHTKADLVFALKTALEREAKLGRTYNHLLSSVEGMQAEIDRCYEAMDSRKAIS